ncbi:hypothetical protein CU084_08320 [Bacillus velezensis]|nr:hypothetical protein CU084_08320 [Bacillus velezensis]
MSIEWTVQETEQLLKHANQAYNTEINDLLLTALGMGVQRWTGRQEIVVNLEGHGREMIVPELDITRTVGWFTSQYLSSSNPEALDISEQIKSVKKGYVVFRIKELAMVFCAIFQSRSDFIHGETRN